jgi:hypothetical protein
MIIQEAAGAREERERYESKEMEDLCLRDVPICSRLAWSGRRGGSGRRRSGVVVSDCWGNCGGVATWGHGVLAVSGSRGRARRNESRYAGGDSSDGGTGRLKGRVEHCRGFR